MQPLPHVAPFHEALKKVVPLDVVVPLDETGVDHCAPPSNRARSSTGVLEVVLIGADGPSSKSSSEEEEDDEPDRDRSFFVAGGRSPPACDMATTS